MCLERLNQEYITTNLHLIIHTSSNAINYMRRKWNHNIKLFSIGINDGWVMHIIGKNDQWTLLSISSTIIFFIPWFIVAFSEHYQINKVKHLCWFILCFSFILSFKISKQINVVFSCDASWNGKQQCIYKSDWLCQ